MLAISPGGQRQLLPTGWSEAGPIAWALLRALARLPAPLGKLEAMRLLTGLSKAQFRRLDREEVTTLSLGLPWLDGAPISEPLRTSFRWRWQRRYWPQEAFADGKCLAYALADEYFTDAVQGKGAEALTAAIRLVATMARPRKGLYLRAPESREQVEDEAERLRGIAPEQSLYAMLYWAGIREGIDARYGDYLFRGAPTDSLGSSVPSFGWWSAFQGVAEGRVFGNLDQVYQTDFHEVCQFMVRKEAARRAQALALEKMKTRNRS